ncbi:MAG: porin [Deltaproteobacteria bacterium]|nr:porin [Deltaproteobacteria bacterium]
MKKLFVIGIAALLLVAFTMPAMAKVKIGGIIFTDFYYIDRDKENALARGIGDGKTSYNTTAIQLPNITRLYGRWTNEDNVGMYIEFGIGQTGGAIDDASDNGVGLRHAYGWWDVNPMFQIMAGKSTTPFSPLNPSQLIGTRSGEVNIIGVGYGDFYSGRFVQVRGTFNFGKVARLAIALVDPNGKLAAGDLHPVTSGVNNTTIPRIDIGVPLYLGPVHLYPGFCYQHRSYDNSTYGGKPIDNNINSYIGSLGAKLGVGPFGLAAEGNWGKNWANMRGLAGVSPSVAWRADGVNPISAATVDASNKIHDAETYSWWVDLSFKFGPVTPHVMYGQQKSKNVLIGTNTKVEAKTQMVGFSVPIDLAKGFRIRPECMWYDDGDGQVAGSKSTDFGKYAIYGVQFQITF